MSSHVQTTPPLAVPPNDAARVASPPPPFYLPSPRYSHQHIATTTTNDLVAASAGANNNINILSNLNNNNNTAVNHQMERVTFHLHSRLCNFGLTNTSYRTRKIFEHLLLVVAICCACALLMLHRNFVVSTTTAVAAKAVGASPLSSKSATTIIGSTTITTTTTTMASRVVPTCLDRLEGFDPASANITHLIILPHNLTIGNAIDGFGDTGSELKSRVLWNRGKQLPPTTTTTRTNLQQTECTANLDDSESVTTGSIDTTTCEKNHNANDDEDLEDLQYREWLDRQLSANTLPIRYSYSTTKAYLMLPYDHVWLKRDMDVQYVLVAPTDPICFGEPFVQFLLWNCYIGSNTVLLNWLLTFPAHEDQHHQHHDPLQDGTAKQQDRKNSKGYVYNPRNQWLHEIGGDKATTNAWKGDNNNNNNTGNGEGDHQLSTSSSFFSSSRWNKFLAKVGVFLRTSFLFFFCTTLVSFTLRETQERMLDFTREFNRRVRQSIALSDLITTHLVQNLVFVPIMLGMMFFLIEFYHGDKFLAFSISSIVWLVESFSLVCLRSSQGLQYFPYFFFLLFLLFHVYQTAFPDNGFVYVALTVVWCFMLHSMVFFWHRYELPALVLGAVTVHRTRMNSTDSRQLLEDQIVHRSRMTRADSRQQLEDRLDGSLSTTRAAASIDDNRLTFPLHTAAATTTQEAAAAITSTRNSSSSLLGTTGGGGRGPLESRPSFHSTTSSRRTSGMYQHNQEDDSSTGSHLYFLGGEVVVHQQQTPIGNASASGPTTTIGATVEELSLPLSMMTAPHPSFSRNESNFSLLSSTSDAYGSGSNVAIASSTTNHANTIHNNTAIGLDNSERWSGDPEDDLVASDLHQSFRDSLPNKMSMETIQTSNVSTPQKQNQYATIDTVVDDNNDGDTAAAAATTSDGYYAEESGGLQAIFETKLTPRHRNTYQHPAEHHQQQQKPNYQRSPPAFPELTSKH